LIVTLAGCGRGAQTDSALEGQPSAAALASARRRRGPAHARRGGAGPLHVRWTRRLAASGRLRYGPLPASHDFPWRAAPVAHCCRPTLAV